MIYLKLFIEFLKIGLFSIGGGLATLPFLNKLIETQGWYTTGELTNMLAISESTPGPIGVNMSTYVGFHTGGILGALVATFALVLPSYIIIIIVAHFLQKFSENKYVEGVFKVIRPVVTGLIAVALLNILNIALFDNGFNIIKIILFFLILFCVIKFKKHPIFYIVAGGILGIILKL
ncbi:MAG: chromate transporter [Eubacteriales bacterium]|nr:chromate transporter [Eubacteriales bacterium]